MRPVAATRGLTLIEVLVAVVVITVVALGLVGIQLLSLRITRSSQESSLATQLAVETLTDRIVAVTSNFETYRSCPGVGTCTGRVVRDGFTADWSVARGSGYELDGLLQVDVAVTGPATARMSTYVSCMDYQDALGKTPTLLDLGVCAPVGP